MKHDPRKLVARLGKALAGTICGACIALPMLQPATAEARDLRIALGLPETYQAYQPLENFAASLGDIGLDAKVFALSLLKLAETPGGIRDGIADVGFVVFPYLPAEFSEVNLAANLSMLATTGKQVDLPGAAMTGALMEYIMLNCPECQDQLAAMNQVYVSGTSSTPFGLICNTPIRSIADIKGKKMRAGAPNHGRWAEHFGGVQVSMPGNEMYDALGSGSVQCSINAVSDLTGSRLIEVSNSLTIGVPGATFSGLGANNFNADVWSNLTTEQRRAILDKSARLAAQVILVYQEQDQKALAAAKEAGHEVIYASDEMLKATEEFAQSDLKTIEKQFTEDYGVKDAAKKIALVSELITKWKGLVADVGTDEDALTDLYLKEVLSKVDAATYGVK